MKILFKKTCAYQSSPQSGDVFEYVSNLALQKINPDSDQKGAVDFTQKYIFYSPLHRVEQSINKVPGHRYICENSLAEVVFDISKMCTREEYEKQKSTLIRKKFKQFFIEDTLPQKRSELFSEIESILRKIKETHEEEVVVFSHSFKLKLFEAYIKTKGQIKDKPELIHTFIDDTKKTYEFGESFSIEFDSKNI
jgi:hypothetical protein